MSIAPTRTRRSVLAAVAGLISGVFAGSLRSTGSVQAADGDRLVLGEVNRARSTTTLASRAADPVLELRSDDATAMVASGRVKVTGQAIVEAGDVDAPPVDLGAAVSGRGRVGVEGIAQGTEDHTIGVFGRGRISGFGMMATAGGPTPDTVELLRGTGLVAIGNPGVYAAGTAPGVGGAEYVGLWVEGRSLFSTVRMVEAPSGQRTFTVPVPGIRDHDVVLATVQGTSDDFHVRSARARTDAVRIRLNAAPGRGQIVNVGFFVCGEAFVL
jgi:hypothetical protein